MKIDFHSGYAFRGHGLSLYSQAACCSRRSRPSIPINFQSINFLLLRLGYFFKFFTYGPASLALIYYAFTVAANFLAEALTFSIPLEIISCASLLFALWPSMITSSSNVIPAIPPKMFLT